MLHPASTHFAIVLPVIASILGIIYLFVRTQTASKLYTRATIFATLTLFVAWYTGSQAGPEIYNYLSQEGQGLLLEHKKLGLYLAIAMALISVIAIVACKLQKFSLTAITVIAVLILSATTLFQGKMGGQLVYKYGTPFKSFLIMESLHEATASVEDEDEDEAKVEIYQDTLDDIELHNEEIDSFYGVVSLDKEESDEEDE